MRNYAKNPPVGTIITARDMKYLDSATKFLHVHPFVF